MFSIGGYWSSDSEMEFTFRNYLAAFFPFKSSVSGIVFYAVCCPSTVVQHRQSNAVKNPRNLNDDMMLTALAK